MIQSELFRILGYIWATFGAYWMGFGLLGKSSPAHDSRSTSSVLRFGFLAITFILLFFGRHIIPAAVLIVLGLAWALVGTYWATSSKSAASGEFRFYRFLRLLVLAVTFSLLFWRETAIGILGQRFIPSSAIFILCGFIAALLGMSVALWARVHLGKFWSDKVVLQFGHELIRTGPYASMRHPIYSGVLLGVLGTALVLGEWRGLLAFALLSVNYLIKATKEEQLLARQFGTGFAEHAARTGFLLPRFRNVSVARPGTPVR